MRLTSNGQLLINQTTSQSDELLGLFTSSTGPEMIIMRNNSGGTKDMMTFMNVNNSGSVIFRFKQTGGLGNVGSVTTSSNSTSYNTSSDYRLKENVVDLSDAITRLKTLSPKRFNFISDPSITLDGFLAHEVTAVPEAITGTKDEVDSDSNPVYQGIDQSKLVPLLTAALQESVTEIESLKSRLDAAGL